MLERFTIRPASLLRSRGRNACVVAMRPKTFVSKVSRQIFERLLAHFLVFVVEHHAGVVDQNVETAELVFHLSGRLVDAGRFAHVELENLRLEVVLPQFGGSCFALPAVARTDQDGDLFLRVGGRFPSRCLYWRR